jgi:hypothetical protein
MPRNIKLLAEETNLASATTVDDAVLVRVYNSTSSGILMTMKDTGGTTKGSITIPPGEEYDVQKLGSDTLEGGAGLLVVKIAWST